MCPAGICVPAPPHENMVPTCLLHLIVTHGLSVSRVRRHVDSTDLQGLAMGGGKREIQHMPYKMILAIVKHCAVHECQLAICHGLPPEFQLCSACWNPAQEGLWAMGGSSSTHGDWTISA